MEKKVIVNEENKGLKNNILDGIDYVLQENESVICLEDDLVVSKYFLSYMNNALEKYQNEKKNLAYKRVGVSPITTR